VDEQAAGTDPTEKDTDGDGTWDGTEHDFGSAPLDPSSRPEACNGADDDRDGTVDDGACETRPDHRATQFLVGFLPPQPGDAVAASLRIAAERPATVTVRYPARAPTFTRTLGLGAQSVATVELPAAAASGWSAGAVADNAVLVSATQEVAVSLRHASEGVDVALAIPEGLLGTEYVAITRDGYGQSYPDASVLVIATLDGTTVTITRPWPFGAPITVTLQRGQGYLAALAGDLAGTTVRASSPVAVLHGNRCSAIPETSRYCEHLFEMAVPARYLGRDHAVASHRDALGEPRRTIFRIVAPLPGTSVRANGALLDLALGPGGYLDHHVQGQEPGLVRFLSDRPIQVVSYLTSLCDWGPSSPACATPPGAPTKDDWGDPTAMTITPATRLPWSYVFQGDLIQWGGLSQTWLYVLARSEDVDRGHVLLDGVPLDPEELAYVPDTPGYRWGVFPLAGAGAHTSRSVAGHGLWLVGLAPWGAASQPLGILLHDTVPEPPAPVSAAALSATQVQVSWADSSTNEDGFRVYRTNVAPPLLVGTAPANATGLLVGALPPATACQLRVRAYNALGEGSYSLAVAATTQPAPAAPPAAPGGVTAVAVPGSAGYVVRLGWVDASSSEEGFWIDRCVYAGPLWRCSLDPYAAAAPNATAFTDAYVSSGGRYRYTLRAFNLAGTSPPSATVEVLVP
jgi:hypothetical protein